MEPASRIGLDIGTSRIVLARRVQDEFKFQSQLNAFVAIPFSKLTQRVLEKENIPHTVRGGEILVYGNEAERVAGIFHVEPRRPMLKGTLNPSEPEGLAMVREIIANLAGDGKKGRQTLYFSTPGPPLGAEDNLTYHEGAVRQTLSQLGYELHSISEGLAVIYAELEETSYTGIGISCGGGVSNVCLAYLSMPVVSFSIAKAGDYVDSAAAAATGETANQVRIVKEQSFHLNGSAPDKTHQALRIYYEEMIQMLVKGMKEAFSAQSIAPRLGRAFPLVIAGGSAMPAGFRERFEQVLRESNFPLPVSEVRLAADPLCSTAKGALVAALAEA